MSGFGRPARRRVTWLELALGGSTLTAVACAGLFVLGGGGDAAQVSDAVRDAARIREAAVEWRDANPRGCPTPTQLKHERKLAAEARTDDPWGSRYRVACTGGGIVVVSAGRDGKTGTADDVHVPRT
jgi:hypothetical protein